MYASPILDAGGNVQQVVEVWRDISDRRREEARLAEFHRLASVGMLASGFSHEVNTPLASMLTCVDGVLQRGRQSRTLSPSDIDEMLHDCEIVRSEIFRCKRITSQFLKFSMRKNLSLDLVGIGTVIDAVVPLVSSSAEAAGVSLEVDRHAPMPTVLANEGAFQHVLLNLLLNAIQATEGPGRVVVSCTTSDYIRIRVQDEGHGIASEDLNRIFEPFFSRRPNGTGLGLFLARLMARSWGGDIAVQSQLSVGSCFEILFPVPESHIVPEDRHT